MKEIKAFVRPNRVEKVVKALMNDGIENMTIFSGEGTGKFTRKDASPSIKYNISDSQLNKIELIFKDEWVEKATNIICENAFTFGSGDGLVYISDIEKIIRVKNGENNFI
jgi:nitrogen regulatory protein P-II 1